MNTDATVTTHVLDMVEGGPAAEISVDLFKKSGNGEWTKRGTGVTDSNGRVSSFIGLKSLEKGVYRLDFDTAPFFTRHSLTSCFPHVTIFFNVENPGEHYHIPLLLSPNGYTTYRGS